MKYKRNWYYGGDHSNGAYDWLVSYTAENGKVINVDSEYGNKWYTVVEDNTNFFT